MPADRVAASMRAAAAELLAALDDSQRQFAALPFADEASRRWLEYRPEPRPGACLALLTPDARKAAHVLLGTGLSEHAFAQAMVIVALEEVLDQQERRSMGRHSGDYWVSVFGDPTADEPWSWRFEGHHLSVTMTLSGDRVSPAPVFFGAHPARVTYAGQVVSRPLAPEEDLARALLDTLSRADRAAAVVAKKAPYDIRSATSPHAQRVLEPLGVAASALGPSARLALGKLVALYLDRLPTELAAEQAARVMGGELHFAWEGPLTPGMGHYYRVQGEDLLIEYDNTDNDADHAHSVLRRPSSDFGDDILAAHHREAHAAAD
jgi:Protein of unknown function (DUF3500)